MVVFVSLDVEALRRERNGLIARERSLRARVVALNDEVQRATKAFEPDPLWRWVWSFLWITASATILLYVITGGT